MDRAQDGGVGWREEAQEFLESLSIKVFNPASKPIDIGIETPEHRLLRKEYLENGEYDKLREEIKLIREVDLRMVDKSDFIFCYLNMADRPAGTWEELTVANRQKKPILIVCEGGKKTAPMWLFGMLPHEYIFDDFAQAYTFLLKVNSGEYVDKRWKIFRLT